MTRGSDKKKASPSKSSPRPVPKPSPKPTPRQNLSPAHGSVRDKHKEFAKQDRERIRQAGLGSSPAPRQAEIGSSPASRQAELDSSLASRQTGLGSSLVPGIMATTGSSEDVAQVSPIESGDSNDLSGNRETEVVLTTQAAKCQSAFSTLTGRVRINFQFHKSPLSAIDA